MADIKTHLRELSTLVTIGLILDNKGNIPYNKFYDFYKSKSFYDYAKNFIKNTTIPENILEVSEYTGELHNIVKNGIDLAVAIYSNKHFSIPNNATLQWTGNDTQKSDPIDITIGEYNFSLKEDSFILTNMGLYQLLNTLTGSNYKQGLHIFNTFAIKEYDTWFKYTWDKFVHYLENNNTWTLKKNKDISTAKIINDKVLLTFNNFSSEIPKNISSNKEYMEATNVKTREKVFSKWINNEISNDEEYIRIKKICSEASAKSISDKITNEYNPKNVYDFFRIMDKEYYYAKCVAENVTILLVPKKDDFNKTIIFDGCRYEVPSSQVNIISTFRNKDTNHKIEFRNECRFSHGQFNGTPEAKMYITRNSSLSDLYNTI